jgi:hypothetical protein
MVKVSTYPATSLEKTTSELELLMVHDRPSHLWLDGEHYERTPTRETKADQENGQPAKVDENQQTLGE